MKRILSNPFIVVFGLAVDLLLGEGLARVMYRGPWYEQLVAEQLVGDAYAMRAYIARGPLRVD